MKANLKFELTEWILLQTSCEFHHTYKGKIPLHHVTISVSNHLERIVLNKSRKS